MITTITKSQKRRFKPEERIWVFLLISVIAGILFIMIASLKAVVILDPPLKSTSALVNLKNYCVSLSIAVLVAGSCLSIGGLLGFLFGIPRILNNADASKLHSSDQIIENDNLVQISDWVTKIIVGVGLTQFYQISHSLGSLGEYLAPIFSNENPNDKNAKIIAIVIVLYFLVLGFASAYLWTRLYFSRMLAKSQGKVKEIQKELEQKQILLNERDVKIESQNEEIEGISTSFGSAIDQLKSKSFLDTNQDDPNKGAFGGSAMVNGRRIIATVKETSFDSELFNVILQVSSINSKNPIEGNVVFYLHPTFEHPERVIEATDGVAKLSLIAYGAFTVGVKCDNGATQLELDLADLPNVPPLFKER